MAELTFAALQANPALEGLIQRMDERICEAVGEPVAGTFIEILLPLLPTILQLFANCPKKPKPTPPVNPINDPTPVQTKAWEQAWDMKCRAYAAWDEDELDYNDHDLRILSNSLRKQHKRNKDPISKLVAQAAARSAYDAARKEDMPILAASIAAMG